MNFDNNAPIIPFKECGGIKLYSTLEEVLNSIKSLKIIKNDISCNFIRYDVEDCLMLFFYKKNNRLYKICTQKKYNGSLPNGIKVGMKEQEFCAIDNTLIYDDFEEIWESKLGYFIETECGTNEAVWISVFVKELFEERFLVENTK
jgi:hypothetical protein